MAQKKAILVATIGTRDLAFAVGDGEWFNVGNDRAINANSISDTAIVKSELGLENATFRELTEALCQSWDLYGDRLQPIVLGKLLRDKHKEICKIYLMGTDQDDAVREREKDTLYAAELIKLWIEKHFNVPVEVILQGQEGFNPSSFEQMFGWWKGIWRRIADEMGDDLPVLLCLKGGVGQSSEASRVTALSRFAESAMFYDFEEKKDLNSKGEPSPYSEPFKGVNYLWDRKQKEVLALLKRFDYEAVQRSLKVYLQNGDETADRINCLLNAAVAWNRCDFADFKLALGAQAKTRSQQWWWMGYEAAYLAMVRFQQGNTIEAMFHSFRAVEGTMTEWALFTYPLHTVRRDDAFQVGNCKVPLVKHSIKSVLPNYLNEFKGSKDDLPLYGVHLDNLVQVGLPSFKKCADMQKYWDVAKNWRNSLFHRLLGLEKTEVFNAWDAGNFNGWEKRVISCLNFLSDQRFGSLEEASLMARVQQELKEAIASYQP